jgi:ectoine hydroxylase-related dioxygenase (phytanoyl-CoA dioxygenase family)
MEMTRTEMSNKYADEILDRGYTIIPDVLDAAQLATARDALQEVFDSEKEIAKKKNWQNNIYQVAYLLPQKQEIFRSLGLNPRLLPIVQEILGQNCNLSNVNGLTMTPGGETQKLHMDAFESTPGTCVYINALHCLDDFTEANGGTRVVPNSHTRVWTKQNLTPEMEKEAIYLSAKAGSVIAYNGALLHAGSRNTTDKPRRALHLYYHRAWAKPQWDYPRSISPEVAEKLTIAQKRLFGFYGAPPIYNPVTHEVARPFGEDPALKQ